MKPACVSRIELNFVESNGGYFEGIRVELRDAFSTAESVLRVEESQRGSETGGGEYLRGSCNECP